MWRRFLWSAAVVSALISVVAFHPSVPQNSREPTWLATFLWTRLPAWTNPLPEVFIETQVQVDEPRVPVATSGCEKVLIAGGGPNAGVWPSPCYPAPVPAECQTAGVLCYANLTGRRYTFALVRDATVAGSALRRDVVWPPDVELHVRQLYDAWNWPSMRSESLNVVRTADHVSLQSLGSNDHFILVLRNPGEGAAVRLRPTGPLDGILADPLTGHTIRTLHYDAEPGLVTVDLPHDSQILLLAMRSDAAH
jgi:hypothetical protein